MLTEFVAKSAEQFGIPGVAVGVLMDGEETVVTHGVTSLANPQPVDRDTLFHIASVSKTFTATALLRLVEQGKVQLDAPVRRYVPELRLLDEDVAERITVLNLLNHTGGLEWNVIDTEDGDVSLAAFVRKLATLPIIAVPGSRASYSQAGYNLAGRIIENVTGQPYEKAIASLLLEPLELRNTLFDVDEVMIRKFVVGHNRGDDGTLRPAVPWKANRAGERGNNPGGGVVTTVGDLLRWARFHLGTGDGLLPADVLHGMRDRTVELRASSFGDGIGICWFTRTIDGVRTIGHGGSGNGQFAELLVVPDRNFAIVSLTNGGPDGYTFNQTVVRWALEHFLGLTEHDPEPLPYDATRAQEAAGRYEIDAMNLDIATDGTHITLAVGIKPELRAASDAEMPPDYPAAEIGLLPNDEYIVTEGGLTGQLGYFTRASDGTITGLDLAGRLFPRTS
ncbi:CubicO group peptidase (beta-lactamase class C family) [Kribbella aluminosa]|uniref:CubicO group peptidase (Beta-lactamase class C family) n=1 Tax=Kribbella aluminosa TaxID=416017 RepID=A0ABS4UUF6_9ACTN|nr:serine hydrolase domain-containing protein [Kribbella aluminosa]MBP2355263.1 CubicO group peptidase (beta-lactamase class C family) [Kribbella aluminosa]